MSKIIKMSQELIDSAVNDFREALEKYKVSDGKLNFTRSFGNFEKVATLYFTDKAWHKQQLLIKEFDKEVAWHGVARRGDDPDKDEYIIEDILVYPQHVTGATVTTDQEEYQNWLMSLDDEVFNNLRMQGHSHVNMGVTPSTVDNALYEKLLDQLDDDMFYIFLIWNKKGDKTIKIYDMAKNTFFDTQDIKTYIKNDGYGIEKWLRESKDVVKTEVVTNNAASKASAKYDTKCDDEKKRQKSYYGGYDDDYNYGSYYNGYKYGGYNDYGRK